MDRGFQCHGACCTKTVQTRSLLCSKLSNSPQRHQVLVPRTLHSRRDFVDFLGMGVVVAIFTCVCTYEREPGWKWGGHDTGEDTMSAEADAFLLAFKVEREVKN